MTLRKQYLFLLTAVLLSVSAQAQTQRSSDNEIIAVVNGKRAITLKEIDQSILSQIYSLQEQVYNLRKTALENLIAKIILEEEAAKRRMTVEELKSQLMPEKVEIRPSQIDQIYSENAGNLANMSDDEARQRIKLDLEVRKKIESYMTAVSDLKKKAKIDILLAEPIRPALIVNDEGPTRGPDAASVTIIEYSDFQCPYCKQVQEILDRILNTYQNDVKLVFKHLPLPIHPQAFKAAQASVCANEQGSFWQYHDRLFGADNLSDDMLRKQALAIGLDVNKFEACLNSEFSRAAVLKDMQEAKQANIQGTPSFVINGRVVRGARDFEDFKKLLEQELQKERMRD